MDKTMSSQAKNHIGRLFRMKYVTAVLGIIALLIAPRYFSSFYIFLIASSCFLATFAVTWDFFTGLTGYFSFAHMFIVALGGYSSVLLTAELGVPLPVSILLGTLIAGVFGTLVIGGISLRLAGIYFAALTFILPALGERLIIVFSDETGGLSGYIFVEPLGPFLTENIPIVAAEDLLLYYFAVFNFTVILGLLVLMSKSNLGAILRAIRQDELLLASLGISPTKFKIAGFSIISLLTGFTGAVWSHWLVVLTPSTQLSVNTMIDIIIAATVGGIGTIVGPAIGIALLQLTEQLLIHLQSDLLDGNVFIDLVEYQRAITITVAILFLYKYPRGVYPPIRDRFALIDDWIKTRTQTYKE